jgi:hypothetical protein
LVYQVQVQLYWEKDPQTLEGNKREELARPLSFISL